MVDRECEMGEKMAGMSGERENIGWQRMLVAEDVGWQRIRDVREREERERVGCEMDESDLD